MHGVEDARSSRYVAIYNPMVSNIAPVDLCSGAHLSLCFLARIDKQMYTSPSMAKNMPLTIHDFADYSKICFHIRARMAFMVFRRTPCRCSRFPCLPTCQSIIFFASS